MFFWSGPALKRVPVFYDDWHTFVGTRWFYACRKNKKSVSRTHEKKAVILLRRQLAQALVCHISNCDAFCVALVPAHHPHNRKVTLSWIFRMLWGYDCLATVKHRWFLPGRRATTVGAGTLQPFTVSWTISVRNWRTAVCIWKLAGILKEFQKKVSLHLQLAYAAGIWKSQVESWWMFKAVLMLSRVICGAVQVEPEKTREALLSWVASIFFTNITNWFLSWCRLLTATSIHEDICLEVLCQALGAGGRY